MDLIDRQAAISAICNACGKIDCDKMDKCEKLQLPPANCSEFPNNSDTISRAKAIEALAKFVPYAICDESTESYTNGLTDAYNLILQLPSAQPELCEDAVSRKAIIDWIDECQNHADKLYGYEEKALANVKRFITSLPSVTPKQRTGKWIPIERQWHCSVCDGIAPKGYRWTYCPSCGAKMEVTT